MRGGKVARRIALGAVIGAQFHAVICSTRRPQHTGNLYCLPGATLFYRFVSESDKIVLTNPVQNQKHG
jgi:hypothetical protein